MAKAKKLPSGNWRVQVFDYKDENGKNHYRSYTAPTKAEAEYMAAFFKRSRPPKEERRDAMTVGDAIDQYIGLCITLSPTTIAQYKNIREHGFRHLMSVDVNDLDDIKMQEAINIEARRPKERTNKPLSPKTVKDEYGLISSALKTICNMTFNVKLPKIQKNQKTLPDPAYIAAAIKGTRIEIPCLLAMWLSFSMSEIRGFKCSSIRNGYIYVDQVVVDVEGVATEKKDAKVQTRKRRQAVPDYLMRLIEASEPWKQYLDGKDGPLVPMTHRQIYEPFTRLMKKQGIDMTFHDLRHVFASVMLTKLQIPEKVVLDEGGWSTPHVMKAVYSNTFSDSRRDADKARDAFFNALFE